MTSRSLQSGRQRDAETFCFPQGSNTEEPIYQTTRYHNPKDHNIKLHRPENLKSQSQGLILEELVPHAKLYEKEIVHHII
jgi:hypothetical protein